MLPTVVSFYSGDEYYYKCAEALKSDCERLGLKYVIKELQFDKEFNWAELCKRKVHFYQEMLNEIDGPILWVDVDTKINKLPDFLENNPFDFGAFFRGFKGLHEIKPYMYSRFWSPTVLFFNKNAIMKEFVDYMVFQADSYQGAATDDYFLEEAWLKFGEQVSAFPFPSKCISLSEEEDSEACFIFGRSGSVADFKDKVDQHENNRLAEIKMKILMDLQGQFESVAAKKKILTYAMSSGVPKELDAMLFMAKKAIKLDPKVAIQLLNKAAYLFPRKYESRKMLLDYFMEKSDFKKAREAIKDLLNSGYPDWVAFAKSKLYDLEQEEFCKINNIDSNLRIKMWWAKGPFPGNFGDILNPYIIKKLTGVPPIFAPRGTGLLAIGSVIKYSSNKTKVWGTGSSRKTELLNPEADYKAVRGPISRDLIRSAGGYCPEVYGDAALLLPLFYNPEIRKKYKLGYIPHYVHIDEPLSTDAKKIDIRRVGEKEIEDFIDEVLECEVIISTSLHGIIVANAYGIPAIWAKFEGSESQISGDDMKYDDYFLGVGLPLQKPIDLSAVDYLDSKAITKKISPNIDLKFNSKELLDAFPYKRDVFPSKTNR